MKIFLKTEDEIELMRNANHLVGETLAELAKHIKPGVTTLQLDRNLSVTTEPFLLSKTFPILLEGRFPQVFAPLSTTLLFMEYPMKKQFYTTETSFL